MDLVARGRQEAHDIDHQYELEFFKRIDSYSAAIAQIAAAFARATSGFEAAQVAQARIDALKAQVLSTLLATGGAAAIQPLLTAGLGRLGQVLEDLPPEVRNWTEQRVPTVEGLENPTGAAVSGAIGNVTSAVAPTSPSTPDALDLGTGALTFFTEQSAFIFQQRVAIDQAFLGRLQADRVIPDAQWSQWGPTQAEAREAHYRPMLQRLDAILPTRVRLTDPADMAIRIERHMWAAWLRQEYAVAADADERDTAGLWGLGGEIEARLIVVAIPARAGIHLTGHWYSPNSPEDWGPRLYEWATTYNEGLQG